MSADKLQQCVQQLTSQIEGQILDQSLGAWLNNEHGTGSSTFSTLKELCIQGVNEGWLCSREAGGIAFGRVIKPSEETHGFSVDVVNMCDVVGPHHSHPNGEIDLIIPLDDSALFDGHPAGWVVYESGSAHSPTVSSGRALVMYLLPQGAIEFTRH